jgi:hypothetical protein
LAIEVIAVLVDDSGVAFGATQHGFPERDLFRASRHNMSAVVLPRLDGPAAGVDSLEVLVVHLGREVAVLEA